MTRLTKLLVKKTQHYSAPTVLTRLVSGSEAVDPHPSGSVTRGVEEENAGKQV